MSNFPKVTIHDLGRLDGIELQRSLGDGAELSEDETLNSNRQGDAATLAVITSATPWVIGLLGLWLLKPRHGKTQKRKISVTDPDGKTREEEVYLHEYASESPSDAVVAALAKLFRISPAEVNDAMSSAEQKQ